MSSATSYGIPRKAAQYNWSRSNGLLSDFEVNTMDREQHLLLKLMEECSELAQDAAKAIQFGAHKQCPVGISNHAHMQREFNDVLAIIDMLNDDGMDLHRDPKLICEKINKIEKYALRSEECGQLER